MIVPVGHGNDVELEVVEMFLESGSVIFVNEAEIPMLGIARSFAVACQEQAEVRVIEAADAATDVNPSGGAPEGGEIATVFFMPRDLVIGTTVQNDCVGPFPIAVKVDDLFEFTTSLRADDVIPIRPSDRNQGRGMIQQNIIVIGGRQKVLRIPKSVKGINDVTVDGAYRSDGGSQPVLEDARGDATEGIGHRGGSGDEILCRGINIEHRTIKGCFVACESPYALGFVHTMLQKPRPRSLRMRCLLSWIKSGGQ